jgi:hypothetical protein
MKVVVNRCFGGFSLSPDGIKRLAELNGQECYFFRYHRGHKKYHSVSLEFARKRAMCDAFCVPDPNAVLLDPKRYAAIYLNVRPISRTDPKLIQVIEELGTTVASGDCAHLEIVEIPDGISWEIEEYDGSEWVSETHRTW